MPLRLTSPVLSDTIPSKYTCEGQNISPPLLWEGAPTHTKSFVLIVEDPDAPHKTWVHWIVYNIPPSQTECQEGKAPQGALEGMTDFGTIGYGGPCPPSGSHRYYFKLYALSDTLSLPPGAPKHVVEAAMKPYILAEAQLMATYRLSNK